MTKITVITICFNNKEELIRTCASIDCQTVAPFEHLIIDGSHNDEIKNYLENNKQPPFRRWICEKDKGISDAFNKGIIHSTGNIIQLLNSGDILYDKWVIEKVKHIFDSDLSIQWCHGKLNLKRAGIWVVIGKPFNKKKMYRGMRSTFHPTMFVKKELFEKYGMFDLKIKIAMDYDFLLRISSEKFYFIPKPLVTFDPDGVSNTNYLDSLKENKQCYQKYFGKSVALWFWQIRLKFLYYLLKSPVGRILYKVKVKMKLENI